MKDSNNKNIGNRDRSLALADDNDLKLNINDRSLSVYERYLRKVMEDTARGKNNNPDKLNVTSSHNSVSNNDKTATQSKKTSFNPTTIRAPSTKQVEIIEGRSSISVKLLIIIGVFCAILLIGVIVVILNATGVLVSLTDRLASSDPQTAIVNSSMPVLDSEPDIDSKNADDLSIKDDSLSSPLSPAAITKPTNDSTEVDEIGVVYSVKRAAGTENYQPEETKTKLVTRTRSLKLPEKTVEKMDDETSKNESEPAISYDDFREEALTVIYREVKD